MPRWLQVALTLAVLSIPAQAMAEPTAEAILASPEGSEGWTYLRGLGNGIEWTMAGAKFGDAGPPFCVPGDLTVTTGQYKEILRRQVELDPKQASDWAGYVLFRGLVRTFPCKKN
ncbi:hypothetical protein FPV16_14925 [Methylobacterium sp. W2]|uniref:hypothetical protein n=1 Tax=Methylobacterium sp. W2 TaxID=2598107 RepID=UPI001D0CB5B1|nr:hypothetical protein [Methylobacterium sp. W2]MCC0807507.1 hypothetical protein [Methylobacterium sp. W2]